MEPPVSSLCSLGGRILSVEEARIDPLDRGFLFGDGLYEAIKVSRGTILHLEHHLDRLRSGLRRLDIGLPQRLGRSCRELLAASRLETGYLYLQVTRGVGPRSHAPPRDLEPTVLILPQAFSYPPAGEKPHRLITMLDPRWRHCDLKTISLMPTVMGKLEMRDRQADEVLFVGESGELREGGSCNLFVRRNDVLETHPLDGRILDGVTRRDLLRLAQEEGMALVERAPRLAERGDWQEALVCGTLTVVQPVAEIDGEPVAGGEPGPWTLRLARAFAAYEESLVAATATP